MYSWLKNLWCLKGLYDENGSISLFLFGECEWNPFVLSWTDRA